ncbi:MAG TPA: M56 family metallopeptidase [Puia sp.]|uniref:M56 family metallopeptidase n=1 Tax=Puia sp. TaxID=2045100 RepID=UPI002C2EC8BA|nr:M56 family metallopeptidase [Puia sp.]HVU98652.1 M56 family metallopeptidase [Puia sp.]
MMYAIQASLTLAILYSLYWLAFRRSGLHRFNRLVLIGIAAASLALPMLASLAPDLMPPPHFRADGFVKYSPSPSLSTAITQPDSQKRNLGPVVIAGVYGFGTAIFLIRLIAPLLALRQLIRKSPTHHSAEYTLVRLDQPSPPFSFFRYIFLHEKDYTQTQQTNILLHEQAHIRQHHTLDILFMELYTVLFWFNPFAWLLNRQTKLNLEYLADQQMLQAGIEPKEYQYQLLQMTIGPSFTRMANYFNRSHLQKRIAMINNNTRRTNRWKYLLFAPVLAVLTLFLATGKAQAPSKPDRSDIYLVIRSNTPESVLRQATTELATDGITLSFSHLGFTTDHQISGFHITVSQNGQTLEDLAMDSNGQPLSEPVVFYWLRSRNGNPTLTRGLPGNIDEKDRTTMQNLSGLLRKGPGRGEIELHGSARIGN